MWSDRPNPMRRAILGAYTYAEFGLVLCTLLPFIAASNMIHRAAPTPRAPGRWLRRVGRFSSKLTPLWRFTVEGEPPADIDHRAYVVVANHESAADPFLLSHLPWDMRWIAKQELFKVPVTGWYMHLSGDIPLKRGSSESVKKMFDTAIETLRAGLSVMVFPEGTRSASGDLLPFKDGAFQMAIEAGVPILPIALAGTRDCRPKGSRWFGDATAVARVLAPVSTAGMTLNDLPTLRDSVRETIGKNVRELRAARDRA